MRRIALILLLAATASTVGAQSAGHYTTMIDVRVAMDDGVRLVADVYIPTIADADGDGLYPCVVEVTPYRKETRATEGASYLPGIGVVLIEVDARGTGGSEGEYDIVFSVREQADSAAWIEWAALTATKPNGDKLCEETVGMYGGSYSGIIQYLVASLPATAQGNLPAAAPHLAAIAPQRAFGDLYRDIVYHGGMVIGSFGTAWSSAASALYLQPASDIQTADGQAAWTDHLTKNDPMWRNYLEKPTVDATYTSDDTTATYSQQLYEDSSVLERIEDLRVPTLHLAGWFDAFTRGQLRTFTEAYDLEQRYGDRGPNHLIVGPWSHEGTHFITPEHYKERLGDWYRYFLETKANGAVAPAWFAGPRVTYFQMRDGKVNSEASGDWREANQWPLPTVAPTRLYLKGDGTLGAHPDATATQAMYASNPTAGTGEIASRWDNAVPRVPIVQWDQRTESGKGLTYQTPLLTEAVSIAGPIGMRMRASVNGIADGVDATSIAPARLDTDFVVKLSDVAPDGTATLVTQGYLRASHHRTSLDRSVTIGGEMMAPFHLHTAASIDPPLDGEARDYDLEVWPTAKTFEPGHRLRIDIYSADTPNHLTIAKPSINAVFHGIETYLSLPIVP